MNRPRLLAYLELLVTTAIWGAAGPVIKFTLGGISALPFLAYRFGLSTLVALLTIPWGGLKLPRDRRTLALAILYGLLVSPVSLGLLFLGLEKTTVLDMTLLSVAGPLLILAAGEIFFHERITRRERLGIGIVLVGTFLTVLEPLLRNGTAATQLEGNLLVLLYLIANTAAVVLMKDLMKLGVSALALTNLSFIIGFLAMLILVMFRSGPVELIAVLRGLEFPYHLGVLFMALLSGSVAYTLWTRAQRTIEISEAAIFSYLYPIFSAPLAVFWLGEKITLPFVIGAIVVAVGVFVAEFKGKPVISLRRHA